MVKLPEKIKAIEKQIEKALWDFELHDELEKALEAYLDGQVKLEALAIGEDDPAYAEQQRVLSYCLMRQGNILRQLKKPHEALALCEREMAAARASGDEITLGGSLMSIGINIIVSGEIERGSKLLAEARELFKKGASSDHTQGEGWTWIIQADLANAGLVEREPAEVIEIATQALEILMPIENWPGGGRTYA